MDREPAHEPDATSREQQTLERLLSRRSLMSAGLAVGAGLFLTGCASQSRQVSRLPGPRWPDARPSPTTPRQPTAPYRPPTPTPEAPPSVGVVPRSSWAHAAPIPSRMDRMLPVSRITVHHDGMPPTQLYSQSHVSARIDQVRAAHQGQGWGDIGYHYIVDPFGRVWEGRPLAWQGAHVRDQNPGNLGVLCLGNFEIQSPTPAQTAALERFVASQMQRYGVPVSRVLTHREMAPTACPGRSLQRIMDQTRTYGGMLARA